MILHPLVAYRDCEHCKQWVYDEKTGQVATKRGEPVPRIPPKPPCELVTGCAKGTWKNPITLNDRNLKALRHYQECNAVSQFPEDSVVRHNARIISILMDAGDKAEARRSLQMMFSSAKVV